MNKLYRSLLHGVNFVIAISSLFYELVKVADYWNYWCRQDVTAANSDTSFFIYLGSLLAFFLNELVYEPISENKFTRKTILFGAIIGSNVSIIGSAIMPVLINYTDYFLLTMFISKCILFLCYLALTIGFGFKTYTIWSSNNLQRPNTKKEFKPNPKNLGKYYA